MQCGRVDEAGQGLPHVSARKRLPLNYLFSLSRGDHFLQTPLRDPCMPVVEVVPETISAPFSAIDGSGAGERRSTQSMGRSFINRLEAVKGDPTKARRTAADSFRHMPRIRDSPLPSVNGNFPGGCSP